MEKNFDHEEMLIQLPGVVLWQDIGSRFVACNNNAAALFGFDSVEKAIGVLPENINCPAAEYANEFKRQDLKVRQEKKDLKLFDIHPFSDGKVGTYLSTKSPWIDGDGQILGTIYCGTALTHQLN